MKPAKNLAKNTIDVPFFGLTSAVSFQLKSLT